ncbi:hypothetical protein FQR65_LT16256 [Abscondita terminalis]|nr:hypothetical protein FQR65_LT16256 [Abscondita terminalis]
MTGFRCAMTMVGNVFGPAANQRVKAGKAPKPDVNDMQVTVCGTHFQYFNSILAIAILYTVLEGAVAVSKSNLKKTVLPGQQLQYSGANMMRLESNADLRSDHDGKTGTSLKKSISLNA